MRQRLLKGPPGRRPPMQGHLTAFPPSGTAHPGGTLYRRKICYHLTLGPFCFRRAHFVLGSHTVHSVKRAFTPTLVLASGLSRSLIQSAFKVGSAENTGSCRRGSRCFLCDNFPPSHTLPWTVLTLCPGGRVTPTRPGALALDWVPFVASLHGACFYFLLFFTHTLLVDFTGSNIKDLSPFP